MAGSTHQVPAVGRAFDVLDLFLDGQGARTVPEITAELGLPRSTTYELVQTLVSRRCLRLVDGETHRYDLGLHLFELGSAYADGIDLLDQGRAVAQELVDRVDETVHIATLDGTDVVYLVKADSSQAVRMVSAVGKRVPAQCTAVGKVLLAGLSDHDVAARYTGQEWTRLTPNSLADLPALLEQLAEIRTSGLAFDEFESNVDVRCVAAPIRDAGGSVIAGLSISVPTHRSGHLAASLAEKARDAAVTLSERMGYRPHARAR